MATSVTLAIKEHAIIGRYDSGSTLLHYNDHISTVLDADTYSVLLKFSELTGENRKKAIFKIAVNPTITYSEDYTPWSSWYAILKNAFESNAVDRASFNGQTYVSYSTYYTYFYQSTFSIPTAHAFEALKNGFELWSTKALTIEIPQSITVELGDTVALVPAIASVNGATAAKSFYLNTAAANKIVLSTSYATPVYEPPTLTSAKLRYRVPDATTYQEIDMGTGTTVELPGGNISAAAITAGALEIAFAITDSNGYSRTTDWQSVTLKTLVFKSVSPASGSFVDRAKAALFSASLYDGCTLSAFKWRKSGATDATTVTLSGVTSYTLPANTITDGAEYEFTFTAVDKYGVEHELSTWRTFTTVDATPTAETVAPSGTMIEADSDTVFTWSHSTSTGSSATKSELQYSADEATWTDLATVTGSATEYTLAAGTLTTGTWYWRVRTYNLDDVASEWSDAAQFIAVGKPSTPLITIADNSPRPTITWQVSEQEGYELTIDGEVIRDYGTGKSWTSPRYLTDGTHTVSVRVQNSYGLWSDMATMSFTVENTAGEAVYLSGTAENSATLNWDGVGYDFFVVYRNGKAIAKTENVTYCDRLYAGDATYYVRGCYTDSYNYGISNEIELEILPKNAVLEGIADGSTIDLSLSDSQSRAFTWTQTRQSSSYHTAGRALPSYDLAEYLDQTLSGTCAIWKDDRADQRELESLLGQIVCLKTENGEFALGPLVSLTKAVGLFYVSYQISVVNSYYEEEINIDS